MDGSFKPPPGRTKDFLKTGAQFLCLVLRSKERVEQKSCSCCLTKIKAKFTIQAKYYPRSKVYFSESYLKIFKEHNSNHRLAKLSYTRIAGLSP